MWKAGSGAITGLALVVAALLVLALFPATSEAMRIEQDPTCEAKAQRRGCGTPDLLLDVAITKTDGVISAVPGLQVTYTIIVSNAGPSNDPSVMVDDTFPASLTCLWTSVAMGGASGNTAAGAGDLIETLAMPAGSSVIYGVICDIDPAATGTLTNTATAAASWTDFVPGNNSATDADTVLTPMADISVTKDDGVTTAVPGQGLTYTIEVANAGPSDDPSVSVVDNFPAALTCSWTSVAAGGATGNTSAAGNLNDTLSMPASSSVTYTVMCTIDPAATGTLSNTATTTPSVTDPDGTNNSATDADTLLTPFADLSITKDEDVDPIVAGNTLTYTVTVVNAGPSTAPNVVVTDTLPSGVTLISTTGCAEDPGGTPNCTLGTLASGGSAQFTIRVTVDAGTAGTITNTASVTSNVPDLSLADNSDSEDTTVNAPICGDSIITPPETCEPPNVGTCDSTCMTITVPMCVPDDLVAACMAWATDPPCFQCYTATDPDCTFAAFAEMCTDPVSNAITDCAAAIDAAGCAAACGCD